MSDVTNPLYPTAYDIAWSVGVVALLSLVVIALISIARTAKRITALQSLMWMLFAIFVPFVGPLSWFFLGRRSAARAPGEKRVSLPL